ncbi:methyltransferase [Actinosynnema sp. NPDC020468]|uniref:methyltransferase n=1 Tax=Actinosynnema sp. NPDC020468 TaxID=3154488 RepID=UPI0033EF1BFE
MPETDIAALADLFTPMALRVAATLRVADHLSAGPRSVADLASASGARARELDRVLAHLACRGVFDAVSPGVYALNEAAEVLRSDDRGALRMWLDADGAVGRSELAVWDLLTTVRTGEPPYPRVYGRDLWRDQAANPHLARSFADQMRVKSEWSAPAIAASRPWRGHVVDVGGGTGRLLVEILAAAPAARGTLLELPEVVAPARALVAEFGLADRCAVVAGDFTVDVPRGDTVVLSDVLNAVDDEEVALLLRRCARACAPDGEVVVVELIDTGSVDRRFFTEMDLRVLVCSGGRMRTLAEVAALAEAAGLRVTTTTPTSIGYTVVELRPIR